VEVVAAVVVAAVVVEEEEMVEEEEEEGEGEESEINQKVGKCDKHVQLEFKRT